MKRQKILMLKGLPASGKSTYAKELEEQGWYRTNKDDIRKELFPNYTFKDEKEVVAIETEYVCNGLYSGKNVVVDNTHFNPTHEARLRKIAEKYNADFEILFIDTPVEICIRRNRKRANSVPIEVILTMYNKYIAPYRDKKEEYNDELEECVIVDLDGTLAHLDPDNPRDIYDASRADSDILDDAVSNVVGMAYGHGYHIIVLTGRNAAHLDVSKAWLASQGVEYDEIFARPTDDTRPDFEVKRELYENHIRGKYNVKYVIDDRPSVCREWRRLGLKTLQVGDPHKEF